MAGRSIRGSVRAGDMLRFAAPSRQLRRLALGTLAALPLLTTSIAYQDMTSLLEGDRSAARWQAFFVPSPAGAIEKAKLSFGDEGKRRLPAGAGISSPNGDLYTMDAPHPAFDSPDEARVNRREKTGRVLAVAPLAPPKAFSAGSILERQSLLTPPPSDKAVQTAFLEAGASDRDLVQVAMLFEPPSGAVPLPTSSPAVMVASLKAKSGRLPVAGLRGTEPAVAETVALGYAPSEPAANPASTLFGRILRGNNGVFLPPIGSEDHAWAATPLPDSAYSRKEQLCLANGIYFEARGESETGQAAVAQVILNRVRNPTYPKTICGVVYQNQSWRNRCQFSFACDGHKKRVTNKRAFSAALRIADEVTRGDIWLADVGSATHYHATYVNPRWAGAMEKVDEIGRHIFYRTYNGGWN